VYENPPSIDSSSKELHLHMLSNLYLIDQLVLIPDAPAFFYINTIHKSGALAVKFACDSIKNPIIQLVSHVSDLQI
jgi:hypothetical protein